MIGGHESSSEERWGIGDGLHWLRRGLLYTELDLHVGLMDFGVAALLSETSKLICKRDTKRAMPEAQILSTFKLAKWADARTASTEHCKRVNE